MSAGAGATDDAVIEDTRNWLRRAVIGLNLCPFAKSVDVKNQVHYAVTRIRGFQGPAGRLEARA
jgi:hypothetical protein